MKVTDLRIGNKVFYNDKNETPEPTIIEIGLSDLILISEGVKGCVYKPIPITEDWLVKFGFVMHNVVSGSFSLNSNGVYFSIGLKGFYGSKVNSVSIKTMLISNDWITIDTIDSVHQLQNLYYALTGSELSCS